MMKKLTTTLILALAILIFDASTPAQAKRKTARPKPAPQKTVALTATAVAQSGSFAGTVYKNDLLGFSITIPDGWGVVSDEVNKAGLDAAKKKVTANKSKQFEKAMDDSLSNTRILFQAYSYDQITGQTGVLGGGVEKTSPGLTLARYTEFNKNLVLTTNANSRLTKDIYKKTIAGTVFNVFEVEIPMAEGTRGQSYFVTSRRGIMFFFVFTYTGETSRKLMEASLETLTLDK